MEDGAAGRDGVGADAADSVSRGRGSQRGRPGPAGRLKHLLAELTGTAGSALVGHLEAQIEAAQEGADLAARAISGRVPSAEARERMGLIEDTGDAERGALIEQLHRSFMTPVDREDLFRLSRSIDDVLDNLRDFVREVDLMGVQASEHFVDMLEALRGGLEHLGRAVHEITVEISAVPSTALTAKKTGNHIRQLYQLAIADLLSGDELDMEVLRRRELLRRLDVVGLRLGEAADALADGAMKRSP